MGVDCWRNFAGRIDACSSQLLSVVVNRRWQRDHGDQEEGFVESDHTGRLERGQDVADEPVRQQEVHQPVQGDHRRRFPD